MVVIFQQNYLLNFLFYIKYIEAIILAANVYYPLLYVETKDGEFGWEYLVFIGFVNRMPHRRLLIPLRDSSLGKTSCIWLENCLEDKMQRFVINGLPPASVLSPLLFNLLTNSTVCLLMAQIQSRYFINGDWENK